MLGSLAPTIKESGAQIEAETLPTVLGDGGQIELALQNLVANAAKFRRVEEREGKMEMLPPRIHISAREEVVSKGQDSSQEQSEEGNEEQSEWIIAVHDEGPGIESKYFERIWIMFQRLHTRTEYEGTGIGLAVCKKIVERHGGRVGIESRTEGPDQGSTFWFSLPVGSSWLQLAPVWRGCKYLRLKVGVRLWVSWV